MRSGFSGNIAALRCRNYAKTIAGVSRCLNEFVPILPPP